MRLYFEIAAAVSLLSNLFIFAMMYLNDLKVRHEREIHDEKDWQREERFWNKIQQLEERVDALSSNVANALDSRPRSSSRRSN